MYFFLTRDSCSIGTPFGGIKTLPLKEGVQELVCFISKEEVANNYEMIGILSFIVSYSNGPYIFFQVVHARGTVQIMDGNH